MKGVAKLRNVPSSARKARLMADLVRRRPVQEAIRLLQHAARPHALGLAKLIQSAVSNHAHACAMEGKQEVGENLVVGAIWVDEGSMLKRIKPAPQGRGHRIRRRSHHVTVEVYEDLLVKQ